MSITTLIQANPRIGILVLSLLVTLFVTIISYYVTDRNLMRDIKARQKSLKEEMKKYRDNPQKMMELNKQMMADFPHQMKQSLKVSMITIIPLLLVFNWLRPVFNATIISSNWIWWYIVSSILFSIALRKIFKLD